MGNTTVALVVSVLMCVTIGRCLLKRLCLAISGRSILVAILILVALETAALPVSVFVVHCEPTRANQIMWLELVDLVIVAESYNIPLSIDFTPQWTSMILEDETKTAALETWIAKGHEIGCHHHGYWGTKERGSTWDGYSNTPLSEIASEDHDRYLGTMADYMALLNALPGERLSGCLGTSNPADDIDYPCQLVYSTQGHALEDAVSEPTSRVLNNCDVLEISHALIASQERGALQELYLQTDDAQVFCVVGHVYNYADFPGQFEQWFSFLGSLDLSGNSRNTVSGLLDERASSSR